MSDEHKPEPLQLSHLWVGLIAFGVTTAFLYLYGFWSIFDINILEFASWTDVLAIGIYPIAVTSVSVSGVILLQAILVNKGHNKTSDDIYKSKVVRFLITWIPILALVGLLWLLIFEPDASPYKWSRVSVCLTIIVLSVMPDLEMAKHRVPSQLARYLLYFLFVQTVFGAYGNGRRNALQIVSGENPLVVNVSTIKEVGSEDFDNKNLISAPDYMKYIGRLGDTYFFLSGDNKSTLVFRDEDLHMLQLQHYKDVFP